MNNRVYINPNFNRTQVSQAASSIKPTMHINPKFSQRMLQTNNRIYVNPSFVKSETSSTSIYGQAFNKVRDEVNASHSCVNGKSKNDMTQGTSTSRYSLVRHNVKNMTETKKIIKPTKIKISRYKSVAVNSFMKNVSTVKVAPKIIEKPNTGHTGELKEANYNGIMNTLKYYDKFKFNKKLPLIKLNTFNKSPDKKPCSEFSRTSIKFNRSKMRLIKRRHLKKNNIPCPLFKKYGKCLRSVQGTCEFLHDKKHVSVCRKFVKGVCHDQTCLLSHDITDKKMPTCYFYLRGMCTKDHCPYLHVKLNDKTKICSDFLKGYCENGENCLNRHTILCNNIKTGKSEKLPSSSKIDKHDFKSNPRNKQDLNKDSENDLNKHNCNNDDAGRRYYKDITTDTETEETSEVIKPTRCKIGALPSFIKI